MLFDEHEPLTLTEYLGCLHAFIGQFQQALSTAGHFAGMLEGQSRRRAFGWAASLDQARYNASLMVERWRFFNDLAQQRLSVAPQEASLYEHIPSIDHTLEICNDLADMVCRVNRFVDELDTFTPDDTGVIREMVAAIGQEIEADRRYITAVAIRLEAHHIDRPAPSALSDGLLAIGSMEEEGGSNYAEAFVEARERFMQYLQEG